jgi:hypothetical protein
MVLCRSFKSSPEGCSSLRGLSPMAQRRSRKRLTPTRPAVAQGLDTSRGPMNIS